jgi:hypothetical protein
MKIIWEGTNHWEHFAERAAITGKLVLSDYAKNALEHKKKSKFFLSFSRHPLYSRQKQGRCRSGLKGPQFETRYFYFISRLNY